MTRAQPPVRVDVVVLTALDLEYAAVRAHLTGLRTYTDANGTRYETGETRTHRVRVALGLTGQGNLAAAALTTRAVTWFRPKALVFAGVAGGIHHDVALGDVVVATWVHNHQSGKVTEDGFQPRNMGWQLSHALDQDARDVARGGTWARLLPRDTTTVPAVHFKPIVSGDVVVDSQDGHVAKVITEHYGDAVAVDMESAGVFSAAHHNGFQYAVAVRAISDRADGTKRATDDAGWQWRAVAHAAAFTVALVERIAGGPGSTRPVGASPYRGLAAFEERDAELFFGRAETADELAAMVPAHRFVTVVGRSGSGKSSLVHAGLLPRMRQRGWAIAAFRPLPGVPAAVTLAGGLLPLLRPDLDRTEALAHREMLATAIAEGRLAEIVGDVLAATGRPRLLVCVDQFEELVAWREDVARELLDLLTRLTEGAVHVVLTVRTETLDVAVHRLGLGAATRVFLLTPMTTAQLREAIEGPVRATGAIFDDGLVTRILDAASDAPGALTLTQFALTRLWDEQDHGRLTHAAYEAFGGVAGALTSYADHVWSEWLDEPRRELARRLLVQLVRHDGDDVVRRTARGSELAPELIPLVHDLATTRLLVTGVDATGEITVDLAHAALATHWQRLRDWLAEDRDFRAWQEDLRESVRRAEPLRGARLTTALRWLRDRPDGVPGPERDFVLTSRRGQRLRTTAWRALLAVIVLLLGVATTFAVNLNERSANLADQLRRNAALLLVGEAEERRSSDPDNAALMSVAAYRGSQSPDVLANLAGEYLRHRDTGRLVDPGVGQVLQVAVSADGRMAGVSGSRGTAMLRLDGEPAVVARRGGSQPVIALSPDGRLLAAATAVGVAQVWSPDGTTIPLHDKRLNTNVRPGLLRFDSAGRRLLSAYADHGIAVWDLANRTAMPIPPGLAERADRWDRMWFAPDGESVLLATDDQLERWPLDGGPHTALIPLSDAGQVAVSGDGRTAVTCAGNTLVYWDLDRVTERVRRPAPQSNCPNLFDTVTDHSGRFMALVESQKEGEDHPRATAWLMDSTQASPARLVVPSPAETVSRPVPRVAATADGPRLVTATGSAVAVTDLAPDEFTPLYGAQPGGAPIFSPDLRYAATTPAGLGTIHLWDAATAAELASAANPDGMRPARFSVDGDYLVTHNGDNTEVRVFAVPSLEVVGTVALPAQMAQNLEDFALPANTFCLMSLPDPGEIAIVYSGLAARLDLRGGRLSATLPLWDENKPLERFAGSMSCAGRPGHPEFAIDTREGVEIWNVDRRARTAVLPVKDVGIISSVRFSQDGSRIAVSGFDGTLEVWDVERKDRVGGTRKVVPAHLGVAVAGFPAPDRVVVRSGEMLRVWDLTGNAAIADIDTTDPRSGVVARDGSALMYWGQAGLTRMPLAPEEWADHLCRVVGRDLTDAERQALPPGSFTGRVC